MFLRVEKNGRKKKHIIKCDNCGIEVERYAAHAKGNVHFCSRRCSNAAKRASILVTKACETCGKEFIRIPSLSGRYCSKSCAIKSRYVNKSTWTKVACDTCGKTIEKRKIHVGQRSYCSRECLSIGHAKTHSSHNVRCNKAKGIKRGIYLTLDGRSIKYDSSYELRRMREYDYIIDDELESWERCDLIVPYIDVNGKKRSYNPDFLLRYTDGSVVIEEVKGRLTDNDVLKFNALISYCAHQGDNVQARMFSNPDFDDIEVKTSVYKNDYGVFSRPTLEYIFIKMALLLAERSTCLRKKVGVVFTDSEMRHAYCVGYNGDEKGGKNQCESLDPGKCNCIHAEINALTKNNIDITGCTCFVTLAPCPVCAKVLINRGVKKVIYHEAYRNSRGLQLLHQRGVEVVKYASLETTSGS